MKYAVSRAGKYSQAVRTGPSQSAVSNLGFEALTEFVKSPNTPGGISIQLLLCSSNLETKIYLILIFPISYQPKPHV